MKRDRILVLYDRDEEYTSLMGEYLLGCKNLPWKIAACTSEADLKKLCEKRAPDILVTSESSYSRGLNAVDAEKIVILSDGSGSVTVKDTSPGTCAHPVIEKYQPAEDTLRAILEIYSCELDEGDVSDMSFSSERAKLIGVFSPVRRCYQTTFSVLMGRLLAVNSRVLYLSFEFCEGCEELIPSEESRTLSDLMYFIGSAPSVFSLRFRSMVRNLSGLDYVPAALSGTDISEISEDEWKTMLKRICSLEGYSYVILDLSESIRGIFEVLRMCDRIYTLTRDDKVAKRKIGNYEFVLSMYEYSDVWEKSIRCRPPYVSRVPSFSGDLPACELIDFVKDQIGAI